MARCGSGALVLAMDGVVWRATVWPGSQLDSPDALLHIRTTLRGPQGFLLPHQRSFQENAICDSRQDQIRRLCNAPKPRSRGQRDGKRATGASALDSLLRDMGHTLDTAGEHLCGYQYTIVALAQRREAPGGGPTIRILGPRSRRRSSAVRLFFMVASTANRALRPERDSAAAGRSISCCRRRAALGCCLLATDDRAESCMLTGAVLGILVTRYRLG